MSRNLQKIILADYDREKNIAGCLCHDITYWINPCPPAPPLETLDLLVFPNGLQNLFKKTNISVHAKKSWLTRSDHVITNWEASLRKRHWCLWRHVSQYSSNLSTSSMSISSWTLTEFPFHNYKKFYLNFLCRFSEMSKNTKKIQTKTFMSSWKVI